MNKIVHINPFENHVEVDLNNHFTDTLATKLLVENLKELPVANTDLRTMLVIDNKVCKNMRNVNALTARAKSILKKEGSPIKMKINISRHPNKEFKEMRIFRLS